MFNLDPGKLLVIAVVAVLLLGPDRLPQVAGQLGNTWRSFTQFRQRMEAEVRSNLPDLPTTEEMSRLARSPTALLDRLGTMSASPSMPAMETDGAGTSEVQHPAGLVTADVAADLISVPPRPSLWERGEIAIVGDANLN
jgi:TatA/E family protein of Tat protein translocase